MAFALADNKTSELAEWDDDILKYQLDWLDKQDFDIGDIGFMDYDLPGESKGTDGLTDPDEVPEVPQNVFGVKRGDIWLLGNHRLMCGDSTSEDDVKNLMDGQKADITFTSPPYNVGKSIRGNFYRNDSDDKDDYVTFLSNFTNISLEVSKYVFVNIQALSANWLDVFIYQHKFISKLKDVLIWNKKQCHPNIQKGSFNTKFEFIYCFTDERSNGRNFPCSWQGKYPNVIETESNSGNEFSEDHKAGFPVSFPTWFIEKMDFSKLVYEPFCGTGTTIIASEKTGRTCYGMELDEHYCSVIIKRWQYFTGKTAIKEV
jgi:DNA modification methylase